MSDTANTKDSENGIILGLLTSLAEDGGLSQRRLAAELGIALGLVNAYLKRCVSKGLVKVQNVPARRYAYYLTPKGFAEKSRLTVTYLSQSFSFFRQAKSDCVAMFEAAKSRGLRTVVLMGRSDLAEIAVLCAIESGVEIVALIDAETKSGRFLGIPLVASIGAVERNFDAVVITDLVGAHESRNLAALAVGRDRVLLPRLLGIVEDREDSNDQKDPGGQKDLAS
ncbi:winged helix-turn-helix transcriptional regulator [Nitrobacter sp. Nb-311A]|uniref:winged helix-turn-helix transcriptional regulator n=1 Tax=Nitrobacter sp. Nb-311A TaxID=314253 RepID=UPI0006808516|nr:winged helix-turn-helix transcriptional regulator [Nitrobacter sp. Nb-311A]